MILGLTDEDLRNLDRNHTIRSHVPVVAPFDGRIIARNLTKGEVVELEVGAVRNQQQSIIAFWLKWLIQG